jgi:MFS family permease
MTRVRDVGFGLSRELWLVQIGIFLNALGWGAVLPFEVIYLHDGRGFSLGAAGLIVGTLTGVAVAAAPLVGPLIDRVGPRAAAVGGGLALGVGYAGLGLAHGEQLAFAAAVLAGVGNGALQPAQSTLLAALAAPELRHRVTAVSRVCTNVGFGLGGGLGGLVASYGLSGLVSLMLLNGASYVAYAAVLVVVVRSAPRPKRAAGGYRQVIHDLPFVRLACTNAVVIAVGWGITSWIIPLYARSELGVGSKFVGLPLLANALTVVVVQVPIARHAEGRRRVGMMATGCAIFAAAYLLIIATRPLGAVSYPALLASAIAIGVGESFYTSALMPLVADLAPESVRGRYMSTISLSWWIGLALGPIAGTQLLRISSDLTFGACAATASAAVASLLALDRRLPAASRFTVRPGHTVVAAVAATEARGG